jgi:Mor family transcriptional regulator
LFIQRRKKAARNRNIFAAYQQGETFGQLAERHGLSELTIQQIIRSERYKVAVSIDAFYKEMRLQNPSAYP